MKVSYQWLHEYLGDALPPVDEVVQLLTTYAFEVDGVEPVGDDYMIDVDVLPNRSSDCLSHRGIARELASILQVPPAHDPLGEVPVLPPTDTISVSIADAQACPRFMVARIEGVTVGPSPAWLQARLATIGQRSINNIVDATNYVMYALGQPLHAYDADLFTRVSGTWQFGVRFARPEETVSLLPEGTGADRVVTLQGTELLITDAATDTPIGLAGVKGGRFAEVHQGTTSVLIEAAHFHPTITRRTARRLGIVIDASKRFENEPSRELPAYALSDIITLITTIAGGVCRGVHDEYLVPPLREPVPVRVSRVEQLLGIAIPSADVAATLRRIGATYTPLHDDVEIGYMATAPFERLDLLREEDYIEEIARLHGLHAITAVPPVPATPDTISAYQAYSEQVRRWLCERGFSEVITSSFRSSDVIELQNALASDKRFLRSALTPLLQAVLTSNYPHRDLLGLQVVQVFEIGTVFTRTSGDVSEHQSLAIGVRQKGTGPTVKDDDAIRALTSDLTETFGGEPVWTIVDGVAECDFTKWLQTLPTPATYPPRPAREAVTYRTPSLYPAIARDIALWVPEATTPEAVAAVLVPAAGTLCIRQALFDQFSKDGRTSYAFRLVFQSRERTLTDAEVNHAMEAVYAVAQSAGWEVR